MKWRLRDYLAQHGITAHQLALESKLSVNSVYPVVRGQAERISLTTIDKMLEALDRLTGQEVQLGDLLERDSAEESQKKSWRSLSGALGDPDSPGDVAERHDDYLAEAASSDYDEGTFQGRH